MTSEFGPSDVQAAEATESTPPTQRARDWIALHATGAAVAVVYTAARLMLAATHPAGVTPDSFDYLHSLGGDRPPLTPMVYALLGHNIRLIVVVQAVVGAACWLALAETAARLVHHRWARNTMRATILVIGLCDMVGRWDSAILSESFAISLGVLLVACVLRVVERPTRQSMALVVAAGAAWALTRELNALYLVGIAAIWLVRPPRGAPQRAIPLGLAVVAVIGIAVTWSDSPNKSSLDNIVGTRVLTTPSLKSYFHDRGMPSSVDRLTGRLGDHHNPADSYRVDPDLAGYRAWAAKHGRITYVRYMLTHPGWALTTPFRSPDMLNGPSTNPPLDGYGGPGYQSLLPAELQRILFTNRNAPLFIQALAVAGLLVIVMMRGDKTRAWVLPAAIAALALPHALAAWHGDTLEVGRHSLAAAVQLRLGLVMTAVILADRLRTA